MNDSIAQSIQSLPPLSKTIVDINKVFNDPDGSVMDLAKVVEHDPMVLANLLKAANSPLYSFAKEIKSASQAVSLFGMNMTRSIAISNSVRKLLNVDMQPYGITPERFAELSELQASLMREWYSKVDKQKLDKLFLSAFLQESGKILIANQIIKDDELTTFASEIELSNNIAQVEKMYVGVSSAEVTSQIFKHWKFDDEFVKILQYVDTPQNAPQELREYCNALHIVKCIVSINKPLSEVSINIGLKTAQNAGYKLSLLEEAIENILKKLGS